MRVRIPKDETGTPTPKEGGSTPILQFVSEAPYAPAGFFLVEGASLPRRMLTDAMLRGDCDGPNEQLPPCSAVRSA